MEYRKSNMNDITRIMNIINKAKIGMREAGIDQWQMGYPNEDVIANDIRNDESYVAILDGEIVGTVAITFQKEDHYDHIREGTWINEDKPYAVIHRIAIDDDYKGKGIAGFLIDQAQHIGKDNIYSIRIDTHENNLPMQRTIMKQGFQLCGKVNIQDGSERLTFEKVL